MGNITLSIPDNVQKEMKHFSEIRWSEVARKAIMERVEALKLGERMASKSKLTQADIDEFNRKIKASARKRFLA